MKIAIVGSAGRTGSVNAEEYQKLLDFLKTKVPADARLVSGGAALADHLAVDLFLSGHVQKLKIYAPCPWDGESFIDTGDRDWRTNPGGLANYYHRKFSKSTGKDSLNEINQAIEKGAVFNCKYSGFHTRNTQIARADKLIALTFGSGDEPDDGGTLDTWKKAKSHKVHYPIRTLLKGS
jgi:hypothetical protein